MLRIKQFITKLILFILFAVACYPTSVVCAGEEADKSKHLTLGSYAEKTNLQKDELSNALENPDTLNKILSSSLKTDSEWRFLKDLNIKFKTFKANDGTEALGFSYNFSKDLKKNVFKKDTPDASGYSVSLDLQGNVAFDKKTNPQDFLNSNISAHVFRNMGGIVDSSSDDLKDKLNELEDKMVEIDNRDELLNSEELKAFSKAIRSKMSTQYYFDFSLVGGLESNQTFSVKQYYYGGQLGIDIKAWNPDTRLAKFNFLDWPFAAIRWLSGSDQDFSPRGSTIPTLLFGVDLVDPQSGVIKELHNDKSVFTRARGEISFRTPLDKYNKTFFDANYRYYQELNASSDITNNGFDKFTYFAAALTTSSGMFVSYSSGRLPTDLIKDKVYELGFKLGL